MCKRLQSDRKAMPQRWSCDCTAIAKRLHGECTASAQRLRRVSTAIVQRLYRDCMHRDCKSIEQRFLSDCAKNASDRWAITERLQIRYAVVSQGLRGDSRAIANQFRNDCTAIARAIARDNAAIANVKRSLSECGVILGLMRSDNKAIAQ
jgi:hypothetical protein